MITQNYLQEVYVSKDEERRIKAYKGYSDFFMFSIPLKLSLNAFGENSNIKTFQILMYNTDDFNEEFRYNFYTEFNIPSFISSANLTNFEKSDDILENISKSTLTNYYYNSNITHSGFFESDFVLTSDNYKPHISSYEVILNATNSRLIKEKDYIAMRIFLLDENRSILDDSGFIYLQQGFWENVYNTKFVNLAIEDVISYQLNSIESDIILFKSFDENDIRISLPNFINLSRVADDEYLFSNINASITYNGDQSLLIQKSSNMTTSERRGFSLKSDAYNNNLPVYYDYFKNVYMNYISGDNVFVFDINLSLTLNQIVTQISNSTLYFTKTIALNRENQIIQMIINEISSRISSVFGFNNKLEMRTSVTSNFIKVDFSHNIDNATLLSFLKVKNFFVFNNTNTYTYTQPDLNINSQIDLVNKNLSDLFIEDRTVTFYVPNNINFLQIFPKIEIITQDQDLSSEAIFILQDEEPISNNFNFSSELNEINTKIKSHILVQSRANENISASSYVSTYESVIISDINDFKTYAYNYGYYDDVNNENSIISGIYEFFNNAVYQISFQESISSKTVKKFNYYYGNEIFDLSRQNGEDLIYFKRNFINTFLTNSLSLISEKLNTAKKSALNRFVSSIRNVNDIRSAISLVVDFESFIKDMEILKFFKVKIVPLHKILVDNKNNGTDSENNIIFESTVAQDYKNKLNLNFVTLFYDTNSSFNWNKLQQFKKAFFYNSSTSADNESKIFNLQELTISNKDKAGLFWPIWDYLFSSIYIDTNNNFTNNYKLDIKDFFDESTLENINYIDIKNFAVPYPFANFKEKYFNFQINNLNKIKILDSNLSVRFSNFLNQDRLKPQTISLINSNEIDSYYIDIDITNLKIFFTEEEIINNAMYSVRAAIHPLIKTELENIESPYLKIVSLQDSFNSNLITQSDYFMKDVDNKSSFVNYNSNTLNNNFTLYRQERADNDLIILRVNLNKLLQVNTGLFKSILKSCVNVDSIALKDFYLRLGLNILINEKNLFLCMHKKINRVNLVASEINIDNVSAIEIVNS